MTLYIALEDDYTQDTLVLANGTSITAYKVLMDGFNLGTASKSAVLSRTIESDVVRVTGASSSAREQSFNVLVTGSTIDDLQDKIDALTTICDQMTKTGGMLAYRSKDGSYVTRYKIAYADAIPSPNVQDYETKKRTIVAVTLLVDAYALTDQYDIVDSFTTDTFGTAGKYNPGGADWTAIAGSLTNASVTGGVLDAAANLSTNNIFSHIGTPHSYGDNRVQLKHTTGSSVTSYRGGVALKIVDANNYLRAYVSGSTLTIAKTVAGSAASMNTAAITTLTTSTDYWIVARVEDNTFYAEHWTTKPTPQGTPAATVEATLSVSDAAVLGKDIRGRSGIYWTPIATEAKIDDFTIKACAYKSVVFPAVLSLNASYGGTVDAQAGVYFTSSGGTAPGWVLFAYWPKHGAHNYVWNGGGESVGAVSTTAYGWTASAVSGLTGAATSVARTTTASKIRSGSAAIEAVCPATSSTGITFAIYRRFRKGVTYTFQGYVRSAADTTNLTIVAGVSGDNSIPSASALSATYTIRSTTWTPTADVSVAYVGFRIAAANATTFQVDDVQVFEGSTAPTFDSGGYGPGIWNAAACDQAELSSTGTYFTLTADANYRSGYRLRGSGAIASNASVEWHLRQDLFTPDDYAKGQVDVAVYARCEVASTQTGLNAVLYAKPEHGTTFGAKQYSEFRAAGKALKAPSSSTVFKPYYLGTITLNIDPRNPGRTKLGLTFTNSGGASGNFGVDYLVVVPARSVASNRRGSTSSATPVFIGSTSETTKLVRHNLSAAVYNPASAITADYGAYDDGLCGEQIRLHREGVDFLIWPSDQIVDLQDSSSHNMAVSHTAYAQIAIQPRVKLLTQG